MLELKEIFHQKPQARFTVHKGGFTREKLAMGIESLPVSGCNVDERAKNVIANCKHALRFHKEHVGGSQVNPSGVKLKDVVLFVLQKMFLHLRGTTKCKNVKDESEKAQSDMKDGWMFCGCFPFLLFGPMPLSGEQLSCLAEDGKKTDNKSSQQSRNEEAKSREKEQKAGVGGDNGSHHGGVSLKDKASVAFLANSSHQFDLKHMRDPLALLNQEHVATVQEPTMLVNLCDEARENGDDDQ